MGQLYHLVLWQDQVAPHLTLGTEQTKRKGGHLEQVREQSFDELPFIVQSYEHLDLVLGWELLYLESLAQVGITGKGLFKLGEVVD